MFNRKSQNLLLIGLITVLLTELATLAWLKPVSGAALAQEGDRKIGNAEVVKNQKTGEVEVVAAAEAIGPQSDDSGIEVLSNAAFRNDGDNVDGWFNLFSGGYIQNETTASACFMAPTYPPDGATLTEFRFSLLDQSPDVDLLFLRLHRVSLTTGTVERVAGSDSSISLISVTPTEFFFDNPKIVPGKELVSKNYAYYVDFCFPGDSAANIRFYGARLFYTPAN